jgi:hypothetical protein
MLFCLMCSSFDYVDNEIKLGSLKMKDFKNANIPHFKAIRREPVNYLEDILEDKHPADILTKCFQVQAFYPSFSSTSFIPAWQLQIIEIGTNMENIVGHLPIQWLSAPLANINFSKKLPPDGKDVIKNVLPSKPEEGKYGVCTSLEEWAPHISKWTVTHAYDADEESEMH